MKHGDKAKSKTASKASGKKSSKTSAKSSKAGHVVKGKSQQARQGASSKSAKQVIASKPQAAGNGKPPRRLTPDDIRFSNALVAAAFKRAIKKYPNAFRRLTD